MVGLLLFPQWRLWVIIHFNYFNFSKSLDIYTDLAQKANYDTNIHNYKACCLYALCRYKEAYDEANKGFQNELNVKNKISLNFYNLNLNRQE
mgnify:CR=1 FL=1